MSVHGILTEDESTLLQAVREFARDRVRTAVKECESKREFARALHEEMAALGVFGLGVPEASGGAGCRRVLQIAALEVLAEESGAAGLMALVQALAAEALAAGNDDAQAAVMDGTLIATLALSTVAEAAGQGESTCLDGSVHGVPGCGVAEVVICRSGEGPNSKLWSVKTSSSGVELQPAVESLGMHGAAIGELRLAAAPARLLLQGEKAAEFIAIVRLAIAAVLAGIAKGSVPPAQHYARERAQFGREIIHLYGVQERLARAESRANALSALCCAAAMQSEPQAFARFALLARWTAAAEAVLVADDALQVFGGFGFSREYPAERSLRDARYLGLGEFDHASAARELAEA